METNSSTWVQVSTNSSRITKRLRIFGGWLVDVEDTSNSVSSVVFVPDPRHEWEISTSS
jgi:hypothetical protein